MLQIARECSGRDHTDLTISYGDICLFAKELKKCYPNHAKTMAVSKMSSHESDLIPVKSSAEKNMSTSPSQCQVFLGGSCNPTTWRQDVAIPTLSTQGITYYNPQVAHWEEALLEAENRAKETAAVLFFVFDPSTRNVASMIETAYLAGSRRKLVVVVQQYAGPGQVITGEAITQSEYEELSGGLKMVQGVLAAQGIPVFSQINHALRCTAKIVRQNIRPQDLGAEDRMYASKTSPKHLEDKLRKLQEAFVSKNANRISISEAGDVFKLATGRDLTTDELKSIVAYKRGIKVQDLKPADLFASNVELTLEDCCRFVAEFENEQGESRRAWDLVTQSILSPFQKLVDWASSRKVQLSNGQQQLCDVYLGGSVSSSIKWRENVAIPALQRNGLSFALPASTPTEDVSTSVSLSLQVEAKVYLFCITSTFRDLAQMTQAAHYMGLGYKVVLCLQMISPETLISGEKLSPAALKDYNRGRSYLRDIAAKQNVPVFNEIEEALQCVVQMRSDSASIKRR